MVTLALLSYEAQSLKSILKVHRGSRVLYCGRHGTIVPWHICDLIFLSHSK
jgi:hypothetical protein